MASSNDVLVQPDAIALSDLRRLFDYVKNAALTDSLVSNFDDEIAAEWVVNKEIRDTQEVELNDPMEQLLRQIAADSIRDFINPFFGIEVRDTEPLQVLHYGAGGHYIPHVDAETLYKDDDGLELWEKSLDRDLSLVYFLNDDFTGGELFFPSFDLLIPPAAGTLVCFPSDHNYVHGVRPVAAGHRYTIVTWARVVGTPSVDDINEAMFAEYERMRPKQVQQRSRLARAGKLQRRR